MAQDLGGSQVDHVRMLRHGGAEATWGPSDPDTTEVQAVGVPAGLDRTVRMHPLVRVPRTGPMEQVELVIREVE